MASKSGTKCQSSLDQSQESEPTLEVFLDVDEVPTTLEDAEESTNASSKAVGVTECRSGSQGRRKGDDSVVGTTEYAISQVVRGDIQHSSSEGPREIAPEKIQSAFVTLFDPIQRESIIQYAEKVSISQASRRFKVPATTIKKWMNSLEDGSMFTKSKFNSPGQGRKLSYSQDTDERIAVHIRDMVAKGEKVSMHYICSYAKTIIREENPRFIASTGWAQRFLVRHSIDLGIQRMSKKKSGTSPESGRGRPLSYSQSTDKAIADYVRGRLADGQHLTNAELRRYAKEEICKENPNFTGSASWAQNFFLRNKIALQSFPSMPFSGSSPSTVSPGLSPPSSSSSPLVSMSPSLSDASLVAAEITPTSRPSGPIYRDTSMGSLENVVDDPMKTALTLLTGDNIDLNVLSTTQVSALQNSLSEFTPDAVSLVDLLSSSGSSSTRQGQEGSGDAEERSEGATLMAAGLESPSSGNVYLNLGGGGEGFSSGLAELATTQVNPTTQTPSPQTVTSARHISEVVAQGSRPLSYAKETDQTVADWVQAQQAEGKRVTFASLRSFAKHLIASENPSFSASVGWVTPFLLRHNLDLSVNRKVRTSRKGTPRKVASQEKPKDQEEEEVHVDPERMKEKCVEDTCSSSLEAQLEQEVGSSSSTTTITPEMLASAIATTFAEAILAQQQQQQQQKQQQLKQQQQEEQQQQQSVVLEYPPSQPEEAVFIDHHQVQSSPEQQSVTTPEQQQEGAAIVSLQSVVESEQEFVSKVENRPRKILRSDKTRTRHTLAEKLEVVQLMKEHGVAAHYVCRMLGIANSTFAGWTKLVQQKGAELQALSTNMKRANVSGQGRPLSYSREKDKQIAQWVKEQQQLGMLVSPSDLSKHATIVISQENPNFTASSGWQQKFLQRHNLQPSSPWTPKPGSSSCSTQGEERVSIMHSTVVEDQRNIPMAVQTEEVTSNDKPYSDVLDEELVAWVQRKKAAMEAPSVQMLCKKAEEVISKELSSFVATLGWAFKFLHRHFIMLDPKPSSNATATVHLEGSRKRVSRDSDYSGLGAADSSSKYLHTPKKVRQMDNSGSTITRSAAVAVTSPTAAATDITVSPSTGNLCEALLALSSQTVVGEGEPALQAAMQNLQNAMQQALKQQQLQLQQQQQEEQQKKQEGQQRQHPNKQPEEEDGEQKQNSQTPDSPLAPLTVVAASMCTPSISRKTKLASSSDGVDGSGVVSAEGSIGGTPYNNYFGKPAREFSPEEKEEVVRYANATTLLKAALKYGVAAPTVWRWRVELKLHQPKYTAMQKKYIIKFAETNSLKEASHRYGITSKTIQNWRKALQSDGDTVCLSGPASEEVLPLMSHTGDQMLEASPSLPKVTSSHDAEVVAYDSHNFQFIVDGGEVSDTGGRGDHDMGEHAPPTPLRMDPVPLEVTNEVDIENVGMEYDVVSSEGHAAKPRCTLREKMQILQYAIEHSVREASQKYGISPGTLYYWKKMSMGAPAGGTGGGGPQTGTLPVATAIVPGREGPVGNTSLMVLRTSHDDPRNVMSVYPGTSSLLEQIQVATTRDCSRGGQQGGSEKVEGEQQYLSAASDVHAVSTSLSGTDLSLLHAVSSLLNSTGGSAVAANGRTDLSPLPRSQAMMARNNSSSGGISSPTEVLVAPLQVASEEVATSIEEEMETNSAPIDQPPAVMTEESVVVVEVDPQSQDDPMPETVAITEKRMLQIETPSNSHVAEEMEQDVEQGVEPQGLELEVGQGVEPEVEQGLELEVGQGVEPEVEQGVGEGEELAPEVELKV